MWLLLLLLLSSNVFAQGRPEVDCLIIHLECIHCYWNKQGTPEVNYTFYGWFSNEMKLECPRYHLTENNITIGCEKPMSSSSDRFKIFTTELVHGNKSHTDTLALKSKVKLNPPTGLLVRMESDSNLWFSWNQIFTNCVESNIRYRTNNGNWETSLISIGIQKYCINLPSKNTLYELQVQSKVDYSCGDSLWGDWSEPVYWGSNNDTDAIQTDSFLSVWTTIPCVIGAITLVFLGLMLVHNERVRIIFLPVVPKPFIRHDMQDWLQNSKGLKESFNPNYNEPACPVREYCPVSQTDGESPSSSSGFLASEEAEQNPV